MKKVTKLVLALAITTSLSTLTGCNKKETAENEGYKSKEEMIDNIKDKKKVTIDGEEMDEFTMNDGMKVQGAGLEEGLEGSKDSE
ncbi:hypothetical protein A5821_001664 [Enterococcus sp. 7F3_DIV0205]|uniref:Lipoprotein n=1 Tax=Candidatus Enterococcus palustris TaxID=1834189 RepID=A0AAQ3Y7P1_9ENTE|nr:hypothetical protein [Enterococcus sp. 7F3_DIV0205]OTN86059.1 hypothetical protein A5821_002009 [Enterococcus sp. 7F3_DIV0205]